MLENDKCSDMLPVMMNMLDIGQIIILKVKERKQLR